MTPEARAARERKQKIFVVLGGLLLVAVLVFFTLPKVLGGSSSTEASTTTPGPTTLSDQTTPVGGTPTVATRSATVAAVETAKITSFSIFSPKDPFVQQVKTETALGATGGGGATATGKTDKTETKAKEFATGKAVAAAVTIVTVNGVRQVLEPGMKFPSSDPLFVLVAENPGSKSVVVGIVGGAYSGGARTTKLKIGKPLTLVNTTTGARYKISLVSVGSGDSSDKSAPATP